MGWAALDVAAADGRALREGSRAGEGSGLVGRPLVRHVGFPNGVPGYCWGGWARSELGTLKTRGWDHV